MVKKVIPAVFLLLWFGSFTGAYEYDRLSEQVSPWYALEKPRFILNPGVSDPPVILSDSSHSYDVQHYRLDLIVPMQDSYFEGSMTMTFQVVDDSIDQVTLDMVHLIAESVILDGYPVGFTTGDSTITRAVSMLSRTAS